MAIHACDALVIDYKLHGVNEIRTPFYVQDEYPSLQSLRCTADQGCSFCSLLVECIGRTLHDRGTTLPLEFALHARFLTESTISDELEEAENGVYLLSVDLTYPGEKIPLYFSVYAPEDTAAAKAGRIRRRPLHKDITSQSAVTLMNEWISECRDNHDGCQRGKNVDLPTRMLDLCAEDLDTDCRLIQSDSGACDYTPYVALSHCWGPRGSNALLTTTLSTLSKRLHMIALESLPRNFKDAITITRLLGIRYLWIDSLCIIQDSKEDWEREGRRMGKIYKAAYLTIAAAAASSASEGFLPRPSLEYARLPFKILSSDSQDGYILLRPTKQLATSFESDVDFSIWNSRAWTLQERYLAKRILHFCKDKLYFECRSGYHAEDGEPIPFIRFPAISEETTSDISSNSDSASDEAFEIEAEDEHGTEVELLETLEIESRNSDESSEILEVDDSFHLFYRLIGQYSTRQLTYATDKLPALAGIASEVHLQSGGSKYAAGLWEDDLAYGLLWMAPEPSKVKPVTTYRGPSWSWIQLDGQITWPMYWNVPQCPDAGRPAKSAIEIVDLDVKVPGSNPFGEVTSAHLILKAKCMSVTVSGPRTRKDYRGSDSLFRYSVVVVAAHDEHEIGIGWLDIEDDVAGPVDQKDTCCLQIHEQIPEIGKAESSWSGLILELVQGVSSGISTAGGGGGNNRVPPVYRRLGIYLLNEENLKAFDSVEEREVKII